MRTPPRSPQRVELRDQTRRLVRDSNLGQLRSENAQGEGLQRVFAAELLPTYHYLDDGKAPLVNACKPAGEWQTLDIVFQAPRFDSKGKKTENARFVKVVLNGQVIHENVELHCPTGHAWRKEPGNSLRADFAPSRSRAFGVSKRQGQATERERRQVTRGRRRTSSKALSRSCGVIFRVKQDCFVDVGDQFEYLSSLPLRRPTSRRRGGSAQPSKAPRGKRFERR